MSTSVSEPRQGAIRRASRLPVIANSMRLPRAVRVRARAAGVEGRYSPDAIIVENNRPVRLRLKREEAASCSEEIVSPDFGVARDLPVFKTTTIELAPAEAAGLTFTCEMKMMLGKLTVEPV